MNATRSSLQGVWLVEGGDNLAGKKKVKWGWGWQGREQQLLLGRAINLASKAYAHSSASEDRPLGLP